MWCAECVRKWRVLLGAEVVCTAPGRPDALADDSVHRLTLVTGTCDPSA
jgi:hypothetical protein